MPLFLLFLFHLFLNPLSLRLEQISLLIFSLLGRVVHVVIFHTERFYRKFPKYKEKLLPHQALFSRKLALSASSRLLLKRQLNNSGYKKFYTFFQRLMVVLIYLVLLPDKQEIKRYFSHKLSSIKRYIRLLKTGGIFALYPQTTYKRIPHNKTDLQVVRLICKRQIHCVCSKVPVWCDISLINTHGGIDGTEKNSRGMARYHQELAG